METGGGAPLTKSSEAVEGDFVEDRLRGNEAFRRGNYEAAASYYSEALEKIRLAKMELPTQDRYPWSLEEVLIRCNRALVFLRLASAAALPNVGSNRFEEDACTAEHESEEATPCSLWQRAAEDASVALDLITDFEDEGESERVTELRVKALYRRMVANKGQNNFADAAKDAEALAKIRPEYRSEAELLAQRAAAESERAKQEALEKLKEVGNSFLSLFGVSIDNFQTKRNPDGTYSVSYCPKS
jgi:tetratricopeptide (TPR) repeat protein